jgi:cell division protein FtsI/penicillin-binding protein 2
VTGNILAMVSKPGYNVNKIAGHDSEKVRANYVELEEDLLNH